MIIENKYQLVNCIATIERLNEDLEKKDLPEKDKEKILRRIKRLRVAKEVFLAKHTNL